MSASKNSSNFIKLLHSRFHGGGGGGGAGETVRYKFTEIQTELINYCQERIATKKLQQVNKLSISSFLQMRQLIRK